MEIPISSFGALESKPLGKSTKSSTPDVQKSTNLKSELWFFHSELSIFRAHNQPKVVKKVILFVADDNSPLWKVCLIIFSPKTQKTDVGGGGIFTGNFI
jgi:hypothetical protein